jgi:hypothetical protein
MRSTTMAAKKRGLQIRPHSLVIGLSFERTNPGTGESLINIMA